MTRTTVSWSPHWEDLEVQEGKFWSAVSRHLRLSTPRNHTQQGQPPQHKPYASGGDPKLRAGSATGSVAPRRAWPGNGTVLLYRSVMGPPCSAEVCYAIYAEHVWRKLFTSATLCWWKSYPIGSQSTVNEGGAQPARSNLAASVQSCLTLRRSEVEQRSRGQETTPMNGEWTRKEKGKEY